MKICLAFPKSTFLEDPMIMPPLGLWYLWSVLEYTGHSCEFSAMDEDELPLEGFDAWLVSGTSPQASEIRRIGDLLHKHGCFAIVGGPHASTHPQEMQNLYDVVVVGEGEHVILEALKGERKIIQAQRIDDLSAIPLPSRKAVLRYRYYIEDEHGVKHRASTMFTSRGCPFRCDFCETPTIWRRDTKFVPVDKVIAEAAQLKSLGLTGIMFYDDILPLNPKRMKDICRGLEPLKMVWRCFLRTDLVDKFGKGFLEMMYRSGLREVLCGVESGSQRTLNTVHKGTTVEQNTQARQWCREIGIRFKASLILGLPGETRETLEETRRWILENQPDRLDINIYIPFPGTPITNNPKCYDLCWADDIVTEEFFYKGHRDTTNALVWTSGLTSQDIASFRKRILEETRIPY